MQAISHITGGSTELWTDAYNKRVIADIEVKNAKKHYSKLYTYKHFRNRLIRIQALIAEMQIDSILLILGKLTFD
jgi:hypothetical protein